MKKEEFKITLSGPGIEYKTEISNEIAAHIISVIMKASGAETGESVYQSSIPSVTDRSFPKESIAEYVHAKNPKRNPDKILAIAGFLVKNGSENFSPEDVKPMFPKIGEPIPANFGRDFRWAVANAWIAESHEGQNLFYVTNTGRSVIDANFSPEIMSKTKVRSKIKVSKKRSEKKDANISVNA